MRRGSSILFVKQAILPVCFCLITSTAFAQTDVNIKIDSIKKVLETQKEDTNKVRSYLSLSMEISLSGNLNSALQPANEALTLSRKLGHKKLIAFALITIGSIYGQKGDYPRSLEYNFRSLSLNEELKNKRGIARACNTIGNVYDYLGDYDKALEFHFRSLKLTKELGEKYGEASSLNNIGIIYEEKKNFLKALEYYNNSFTLKKEIGYVEGEAACLDNLGTLYTEIGFLDLKKALSYHKQALEIRIITKDKIGMASSYINSGMIYVKIPDAVNAKINLTKGLALAKETGSLEACRNCYLGLTRLDSLENNYESALKNFKMHVLYYDSMNNEVNTRKNVQEQMQYEFEKQQTTDSLQHAEEASRESLKHEQQIKQQKIYTYGGAIGFLLMLAVALVSFRAFRGKQKANEIIAHQKELVEQKQKEVVDSIYYARRIQASLLPTEKYIRKNLNRLNKKL